MKWNREFRRRAAKLGCQPEHITWLQAVGALQPVQRRASGAIRRYVKTLQAAESRAKAATVAHDQPPATIGASV